MATATRRDTNVGRFYEIDGELLPSVTHILSVINKPALVNWAATQERTLVSEAAADLYAELAAMPRIPRPVYLTTLQGALGKQKAHQKALASAGEIGTQVHRVIEWQLRKQLGRSVGPEPDTWDAAAWAVMAYEDWAKAVNLEPLRVETIVFSQTYRYAGTMDLLAKVNGIPTLVDFKTGKSVYAEAHLQSVAYRRAMIEMGLARPERGLIVRLPKVQSDPAFEVVESPAVDDLLPTFLAALKLWAWWHEGEKAYAERRKAQKAS